MEMLIKRAPSDVEISTRRRRTERRRKVGDDKVRGFPIQPCHLLLLLLLHVLGMREKGEKEEKEEKE